MENIGSLYIHIPFCKKICSYCNFCKVLYDPKWVRVYLLKLQEEIYDRYMDNTLKTIYIGGGTPSSLSLDEIKYLLSITNNLKKDMTYEFTFECNIEDINKDLLILLKEYGVNRLSIGIESFNESNLKFLNRTCDYDDTLNKIKLAKELGFNNINVDLIYAIPNETMDMLKDDLKKIMKLKVEHISTYSLIVEDNTYLKYKHTKNISEDLDYEMYEYIRSYLKRHGYNHYEVSNFSKEGYESRHNLCYWNNYEYYGFGCGASGYVDGVRYNNEKSLTKYLEGSSIKDNEILSIEDKMEYEIILGLRKMNGIDLKDFYIKYDKHLEDMFNIKELIENKDLILKDNHLFINPKKIYVMNEILLKIV